MVAGPWPTRVEAETLLREYTSNRNLINHALAVEAVMRAYARRFGEDEDQWSVLGLLHDFDYERHPDPAEHGRQAAAVLTARGYAPELADGILAHVGAVPRSARRQQALCAVDDLTGLVVAVALVRPSRRLADVTVAAVRKKWTAKGFAAGADRGAAERGAGELGVTLDDHIGTVLAAMQGIAGTLGL